MTNTNSINGAELVITHEVNAPRELVFKAFTEAGHLAWWWGPKDAVMGSVALELKPGGKFHYSMTFNGMEMWGLFIYEEIAAPERLVFINSFSDKAGNIIRAPFSATWPLQVYNVLTLTENDGKTTITLKGWPHNATEEEIRTFAEGISGMQQGFAGTFLQLDQYLANLYS